MSTKSRTEFQSFYRIDQPADGNPETRLLVPVNLVRTRTGFPNFFWRSLVSQGATATTPFSGTHQLLKRKNPSARASVWVWKPNGLPRSQQKIREAYSENYTDFIDPVFANPSSASAAFNQCMTRAYKAIRQEMYQISGPTFIGELRQSLVMLKRPFPALRSLCENYFSALSKRKRGVPKRDLPRVLGETWLEYSFGWQPLLSDVKSAAETFARFETDLRRSRVKAFGESRQLIQDVTQQNLSTAAGLVYFYRFVQGGDNFCVQRVGINATLAAPFGSARRLIELSGFQAQEFIPTAWELLPWSFLIDYFSNVGDVLSSSCTDTSRVTWGARSIIAETYFDLNKYVDWPRTKTAFGSNFFAEGRSTLGSITSIRRSVTRSSNGPEYPSLRFELPGRSTQFLNMGALIAAGRRLTPYY